MIRALALAACLGLAAPAEPARAAEPSPALAAAEFRAFLDAFRPEAERAGVPQALFEATFAGMTPDPTVLRLTRAQPEFAKPIGAYLAVQVTAARVAAGRILLDRWRTALDAIEQRFGVPRAILVAIWGLETNYGASAGGKDVVRSIATLAAGHYRPDLYGPELLAALRMLRDGDVPRENLRGSWAGAMGQPQFMPSSYEKYAVDQDRDGRRDIWGSVPDSLASIANFLATQGWQAGRPWGFEVRVPPGFDNRASRAGTSAWTTRGLTRPNGAPLPDLDPAILFYPAGAAGPVFLVSANFEVIKTYNFSDAYVLSVAQLADRMEGRDPVQARWPDDPPMGREARIALQARLAALGYPVDNRQGRISLALRDTVRRAQESVGLPVDGNPTDALLQALRPAP